MHHFGLLFLLGKDNMVGMNKGMDYNRCNKGQGCSTLQEQLLTLVDYKSL